MSTDVSTLSLTHGQVARALAHGQDPPKSLIDQMTYLRRLGIPFTKAELGKGRGYGARYGFDHLIELGIAVSALDLRVRPKDIAEILVPNRKDLRGLYRQTQAEIHPDAYQSVWVQSKGKRKALVGDEIYVALHDRQSAKRGTYELVDLKPSTEKFFDNLGEVMMRYPDGTTAPTIQLKRLITELVGLATAAPITRPGRK